jgi:hypothetical protein
MSIGVEFPIGGRTTERLPPAPALVLHAANAFFAVQA